MPPDTPSRVPVIKPAPIVSTFSLTDINDTEQFRRLGAALRLNPDDTLRRTLVGARVVCDASGARRTELVTSTATDNVQAQGQLLAEADLRAQLAEAVLHASVVAARADPPAGNAAPRPDQRRLLRRP